jgi:hypothetical protein
MGKRALWIAIACGAFRICALKYLRCQKPGTACTVGPRFNDAPVLPCSDAEKVSGLDDNVFLREICHSHFFDHSPGNGAILHRWEWGWNDGYR